MLVVSLLSWWYGAGWRDQINLVSNRLLGAADRYSISLLLRSLFAPFRQISAASVNSGPLDARMRAWADKLISRCIGAMVRSVLIITGTIFLVFEIIVGVIRLIVWPILPMAPVIGFILMSMGWLPWLK